MSIAKGSFQNEANRRNAQGSTGPKTDEGKARSAQNARKHGLTAILPGPGEEMVAIEEERERWIDCFHPESEVGVALADAAFRCKRRLDAVSAAEDAAMAKGMNEAMQGLAESRRRKLQADVLEYQTNPTEAVWTLGESVGGCDELLGRLQLIETGLADDDWKPEHARALRALEGRDPTGEDTMLAEAQRFFDGMKAIAQFGDATPSDAERLEVEQARAAIEPRAISTRTRLTFRLESVRRRLELQKAQVVSTERIEAAWTLELARFDPSDSARLRRRYAGEALREFLKATAAAQAEAKSARKAAGAAAEEAVPAREAKLAASPRIEPIAASGGRGDSPEKPARRTRVATSKTPPDRT